MISISSNLNLMIKAAEKASKSAIRDFGEVEKLQVSSKGPGDFVTSADKRTEKIIVNELLSAYPNYGILSEEMGEINKQNKNNRWIIDPIDGTSNFLNGIPQFAISIGYEKNNEIVNAIIFDPIKNEVFISEKGKGAFLNNKRIRVSKRKKINECLIAGSGNDINIINEKIKGKVTIRNSGSAALDMAYVGAGRYDGYFQKSLNIWDIAAGIIILKEAGGKINDIDYSSAKVIKVLAGSNSIYEKMIENLNNF